MFDDYGSFVIGGGSFIHDWHHLVVIHHHHHVLTITHWLIVLFFLLFFIAAANADHNTGANKEHEYDEVDEEHGPLVLVPSRLYNLAVFYFGFYVINRILTMPAL